MVVPLKNVEPKKGRNIFKILAELTYLPIICLIIKDL